MGVSAVTGYSDILGSLGLPARQFGLQVAALQRNPIGTLMHLRDAYTETALKAGTSDFEKALESGSLPAFGALPSPFEARAITAPICGAGYAKSRSLELNSPASNDSFLQQYFDPDTTDAAQFGRTLQTNAYARAAFEAEVGGNVVFDGRDDGRLTIERYAPGFAPMPGSNDNPMANTMVGMMFGMDQAVLAQARQVAALNNNPASAAAMNPPDDGLGGFGMSAPPQLTSVQRAQLTQQLTGGNPLMGMLQAGCSNILQGMNGEPFGFGVAGLTSGTGVYAPGGISTTLSPNASVTSASQAQIDNVLSDPSLSVEDKVAMMIMLIMNKMDDDIEAQGNYINKIQQASTAASMGTAGTKAGSLGGALALGGPTTTTIGNSVGNKGAGATNSGASNLAASSIDVETLKLKRMIDKRGQMFDTLRQIIDKYNETAKNIIQSIGR